MMQLLFAIIFMTTLFADEKLTTHTLQLEKETLTYTATVGSGEVSYIAYIKQTPENRPITFAFNGGPGSSGVWLHLGTFGPRRVLSPEEGQSVTPPYKLVDNLETILDLTDIVFIDPSGTGLSTADEKSFSIKGDIESVGKFIREYLTKNRRWNAPKYLAGESYGATRAAGLAEYLQEEFGIYFNGIILVSPAIDYQTFIFDEDNCLPYFLYLPTYATTAWYHGLYRPEASLKEVADEAREFAYKIYAPSLLCPKCFRKEAIHENLSILTGLSPELIERYRGRISDHTFCSELLPNKMVGRFDSRITGRIGHKFDDPSYSIVGGIFSAALHDYLHQELDSQNSYLILSMEVNMKWNFHDYNSWGYPNLMNGLRKALVANPKMKVFVGCGYFDLATPFATAEYCMDHLDIPEIATQIEYYEGGHMYYLNPTERVKFKQDLTRFYED